MRAPHHRWMPAVRRGCLAMPHHRFRRLALQPPPSCWCFVRARTSAFATAASEAQATSRAWVPTITHKNRPRSVLSSMAGIAMHPFEKRSIDDLLQMAQLTPEARAELLHETLKVGLARCAMRLSSMPFGFCNAPSIKRVTSVYVQNFQQVMEFEHCNGPRAVASKDYHELARTIFNQHRGTMLDVAQGVFEFYEDLYEIFGKDLELAEVRKDFALIQDIEESLDEFFTTRLTLRLLISHVHNLDSGTNSSKEDMVGVVNVNTKPINILSRAYVSARLMCQRDFQMTPDLYVNGLLHEDFVLDEALTQQHFAYVTPQLFYIFFELMKNSARASVERVCQEAGVEYTPDAPPSPGQVAELAARLPAMRVIMPEGQPLWNEERCLKLADYGTGMNRDVLSKAFCYFYSSERRRPTMAEEVGRYDKTIPLAGFGFGLPISRVMSRYFSGDLELNSIPGKGTDVYIYL